MRGSWSAYHVLMLERLIGMDKHPGVRHVGVGETWRRIMDKLVVKVAGQEANEACGMEQLCGGMEAGIEGGIHKIRLLWAQNAHDEYWGFLLTDAFDALNEENWTEMLWYI